MKEFGPRGANSFLKELIHFEKGRKNENGRVTSLESTVKPLYKGTHYNSRILYKVILICTKWLYCYNCELFITAISVKRHHYKEGPLYSRLP